MKKIAIFFLLFFISVISLLFLYLWATYTDKTITSGSAYGFTIGDSKLQTYKNIPNARSHLNIGNSPIFISAKTDEHISSVIGTKPDYEIMVQTYLNDERLPVFVNENKWNFYFNGTYFDSLKLKFCDEKLCEIHRHRKKFELP
jgi:hypothetical protein